MKSKAIFVAILFLSCSTTVFGQGRAQQAQPPPTDKVTPEIPGLVAAGTKIEVVKYGLRGSDGVIGCRTAVSSCRRMRYRQNRFGRECVYPGGEL